MDVNETASETSERLQRSLTNALIDVDTAQADAERVAAEFDLWCWSPRTALIWCDRYTVALKNWARMRELRCEAANALAEFVNH